MTRTALTKLFFLVILAFIICLPEFFTLHKAFRVNFLCLPFRPCERGIQVKTGENGRVGNAGIRRQDKCDLWEQACGGGNGSDATAGGPETGWFECETDMDMTETQRNLSSSDLKVFFIVSVVLQLHGGSLNLTLYGLGNHSTLHFHLPEEEQKDDDEGQMIYCCLAAPPASESATKSRCILLLANQTVLQSAAAKGRPPQKDEWRCVFRVLWLVLLCVVLLSIVTTVLGQIYWGRCSYKKANVHPAVYDFTHQQPNDGETQADIVVPKAGMMLRPSWSELTPIEEVDSLDDLETLLDGTADQCGTANLHHRSHHSTSSLSEEQAW